jgi:RNA polymerase sigma factor (sigma-70 family)
VESDVGELLPVAVRDSAPVEDLLDLRAALRTLSPGRRAIVVLRYYCDYSIEQTAQILGCSIGTVKSQTSRALGQLRVVLESDSQTSSMPGRTQ